MKLFGNILIILTTLFISQEIFGQENTIEIFEEGNVLKKYFSEAEILNDGYSGIKELQILIPASAINDRDFNEQVENVNSDKISLFLRVYYEDGSKTKIIGNYENGNLYSEVRFTKDGANGRVVIFFNTGEKFAEFYSNKGKIISPDIGWYKNGMIKSIYDQSGSKFIIKEWYKNGNIGRELICDNLSQNDCHEKIFYPEGSLLMDSYYNSGLKPFKMYWENGNLLKQGNIINLSFSKIGKWLEFHENGLIKLESYYHESKPNVKVGKWKHWNERGDLMKEEVYDDGNLISTKEFCNFLPPPSPPRINE